MLLWHDDKHNGMERLICNVGYWEFNIDIHLMVLIVLTLTHSLYE